jgi:hypothetical protein
MRYLTVDGMFAGTGIRDSVEGGYLAPSDLGLSSELATRLSAWLREYETSHHAQYRDVGQVARLDQEGEESCAAVRQELPDAKVEYYSDALMRWSLT